MRVPIFSKIGSALLSKLDVEGGEGGGEGGEGEGDKMTKGNLLKFP